MRVPSIWRRNNGRKSGIKYRMAAIENIGGGMTAAALSAANQRAS